MFKLMSNTLFGLRLVHGGCVNRSWRIHVVIVLDMIVIERVVKTLYKVKFGAPHVNIMHCSGLFVLVESELLCSYKRIDAITS